MNEAAFRLESFSADFPDPLDLTRRGAVDSAYRDGLAEGRAMGFSPELRALTEAIRDLGARMAEAGAIRAEAERQALSGIMPVLDEIVTALASRSESAGLETALRDEMLRLATGVTPPGWHIVCPPGMEAMIRRCAGEAGIGGVDIRIDGAVDEASVILDQGRSAFSNQQVAQHFRALISELQEGHR